MAQNGPRGHQDGAPASDDSHGAPPTTVALSLTSAGPNMENMDAIADMGKNLIPDDLNMEEHDLNMDKPRSEAEVATADADADKGKSMAAAADADESVAAGADGHRLIVNIIVKQERRKRMKDLFKPLRDVLPHVPPKADEVTLMGEAIQYIMTLEEKAATLREELGLPAAAARGEASASSFSLTQGTAAQHASDTPRGCGGVHVPPAAPAVPASSGPGMTNVELTVDNDSAHISVSAPVRHNILTMVNSVLDNHGIDLITVQVSSDSGRAQLLIFAQLNGTDGANRSSEEVFQMAVSEIRLRLNSNY